MKHVVVLTALILLVLAGAGFSQPLCNALLEHRELADEIGITDGQRGELEDLFEILLDGERLDDIQQRFEIAHPIAHGSSGFSKMLYTRGGLVNGEIRPVEVDNRKAGEIESRQSGSSSGKM